MRLATAARDILENIGQFERGSDRTPAVVRQFFEQAIGNAEVPGEKVESIWRSALQRIATVKARAGNFATIIGVTDLIARAGAPGWAKRARTEPALDNDLVLRSDWRNAWDHAAADAIDARERLAALARGREDSDKRCRKLFAELVRERTFYELDRRLTPFVKAAPCRIRSCPRENSQGTRQNGRTAPARCARCHGALLRCGSVLDHADLARCGAISGHSRRAGPHHYRRASQSDVTVLPARTENSRCGR